MMASLPDELWMHIVHAGVVSGTLLYQDLCALAIVCRRWNRICGSNFAWKQLAGQDFPDLVLDSPVPGSKLDSHVWKGLYRMRFEKAKGMRMAAHLRNVHRVASSLMVLQRQGQNLETRLRAERSKLLSSKKALKDYDHASSASVALQVWQPHAVSTRHEQVIQQMSVDTGAHKNDLWMEVQVCNSNICCIANSLCSVKSKIKEKQREFDALNYNRIQDIPENKAVGKDKLCRKRPCSSRFV